MALCGSVGTVVAGALFVPNGSFEAPVVPPVNPYAGPEIDYWQKSPQPGWYDPAQNGNTPWDFLVGQFFNVPFPDLFIVNCDGNQAAFLFAVPEVALFQDYDSVYGTNTTPSHAFDAKYQVGRAYELTVGVLGGGGGMQPGASLLLQLYYRDAANNQVTVASAPVTYSAEAFPTNTILVDYTVRVPTVQATDAWAGRNIGIQLLSTATPDVAGGYWDLDNVRLIETMPPTLGNARMTNGQFSFTVVSEAGARLEIQATTNPTAGPGGWISVGTVTNESGATVFTDTAVSPDRRYYRARQW